MRPTIVPHSQNYYQNYGQITVKITVTFTVKITVKIKVLTKKNFSVGSQKNFFGGRTPKNHVFFGRGVLKKLFLRGVPLQIFLGGMMMCFPETFFV